MNKTQSAYGGHLGRWRDINEGFIVDKLLELKFEEEMLKVKSPNCGGGQVRSGEIAWR